MREVHTEERVWFAPGEYWFLAVDSEAGHLCVAHGDLDDNEEDGDAEWVIDMFSRTVV